MPYDPNTMLEFNSRFRVTLDVGSTASDARKTEIEVDSPLWNYFNDQIIEAKPGGVDIDLSQCIEVGYVIVQNQASVSSVTVAWTDRDSGSSFSVPIQPGEWVSITNPNPGQHGTSYLSITGGNLDTRLLTIGRTPELSPTGLLSCGCEGTSLAFYYYSGTGEIDVSTATLTSNFRLSNVFVTFGAGPTTPEDLTIGLDSGQGPTFDSAIQTIDPADVGGTEFFFEPSVESFYAANDQIVVTYPGTDAIAWTVRIAVEVV